MILTAVTYTIDVPPMLNVGDKVYVNTLSFKDQPITKTRIKDYERSLYLHAWEKHVDTLLMQFSVSEFANVV